MGAANDEYNLYNRFWSKKGKVWNGIGPLKLHLKQFKEIPPTWQIHEFELREELTKIFWPGYVINKLTEKQEFSKLIKEIKG